MDASRKSKLAGCVGEFADVSPYEQGAQIILPQFCPPCIFAVTSRSGRADSTRWSGIDNLASGDALIWDLRSFLENYRGSAGR
jgi:hypothetical protein